MYIRSFSLLYIFRNSFAIWWNLETKIWNKRFHPKSATPMNTTPLLANAQPMTSDNYLPTTVKSFMSTACDEKHLVRNEIIAV